VGINESHRTVHDRLRLGLELERGTLRAESCGGDADTETDHNNNLEPRGEEGLLKGVLLDSPAHVHGDSVRLTTGEPQGERARQGDLARKLIRFADSEREK
jgi:hypothetical protein